MILVKYGKVFGSDAASTCIHGGATFVLPLFQDYAYLHLEPMVIDIPLAGALSLNNIRVDVPATFTVGISTNPVLMNNAAERLLNLDERKIRDQFGRMLSGGGFDPARDIEAITVNRWPHGYAYTYNTLYDPEEWALGTPDDRPCVVGRRRFGRIAIANSDAAASPHTDAAVDEAYRAVAEIIS